MKNTKLSLITIAGALVAASTSQAATSIRVTIDTLSTVGLAPGIAGFSNGSFDIFDPGSAASAALENLAETGSPADFSPNSGGAVLGPGVGPGSPPIFAPGASGSAIFTVPDGDTRFNFAAMLLPSNDWFIGNGSSFDVSSLLGGNVGDSLAFEFTTVWDAGTELEDFAFSPGNGLIGVTTPGDGGPDSGADQNGVVTALSGSDPFARFLNPSAGFNSAAFDFTGSPIARVTLEVVPEPSSTLLAGLGLMLGLVRRRR